MEATRVKKKPERPAMDAPAVVITRSSEFLLVFGEGLEHQVADGSCAAVSVMGRSSAKDRST
jgi:hypothetical protein